MCGLPGSRALGARVVSCGDGEVQLGLDVVQLELDVLDFRADVGGDLLAEVTDAERAADECAQERAHEKDQHVDLTSPAARPL